MRRLPSGFTLVELCVTTAVVAVLAGITWPSFHAQLTRARRADAVAALTKLQSAQESFLTHHASYAGRLNQLQGASSITSPLGLYDISLLRADAAGYEALATARADGPMANDTPCAVMRLRVQGGMAEFEPANTCWVR